MAMKNVKVIDDNTIEHKGKRYKKVIGVKLAKKGDVVKRKNNTSNHYTENAFYKIKSIDSDGDYRVKDDVGDLLGFLKNRGELFRKVKTQVSEEISQDKPQLKAGDFVTIENWPYIADITAGKAYQIHEYSNGLYFLDDVGDPRSNPLINGAYTIVDAEEAKWANIGRKVNEAREGDIVQVTEHVSAKPVGTIFKVASVYDGISHIIDENGKCYTLGANVELVAPAESTFK